MIFPPNFQRRILIVEDELIVAADIASRLVRMGYQVVGQTDTAQDALQLAAKLLPDLVLMDIRLHGAADGVGAADEIRNRYRLPVVYLTAHADEATLQRAKVTEPFGYVLKPFEERELRTALEMALYKHAADRRLAESERRYATTLSSIGDAVIATNTAGCVSFLNPIAEQLTGWPLAEAAGQPLMTVFRVVDELTQQPIEYLSEPLPDGPESRTSTQRLLISRTSTRYPIFDTVAPIRDDLGNNSGLVLVFRDVSKERQREERTRHSQKMEAIGRLAGGVAHDFNNLLTVIGGYCSLLLDSVDADHPFHGPLAEVARATERAADLTRQLLVFGRQRMVQPKTVDLNQIISESLRLLRRLIAKNIELVTELHPQPLLVEADPGQIEQVIVNLAINARDAMPDGGELLFRTHPVTVGDRPDSSSLCRQARLTVRDQGIGMDAETLAKIWEPFFTTKEVGKGTGLGLATVYGIVNQSRGTVAVASEPGKGTTFTIHFPLADAQRAFLDTAATTIQIPRGTETILLVEDEESIRQLAGQILRGAGYTILEAQSGIAALETASRYSGPIHLLATDLMMPQMSGRTLADIFQSQRRTTPILYMSGHGEEELLRAAGSDAKPFVLAKPYSPKELATRVREILDTVSTDDGRRRQKAAGVSRRSESASPAD